MAFVCSPAAIWPAAASTAAVCPWSSTGTALPGPSDFCPMYSMSSLAGRFAFAVVGCTAAALIAIVAATAIARVAAPRAAPERAW